MTADEQDMIANSVGASHASATALLHARMHDAIPGQARKSPPPDAPPPAPEPTVLTTTAQQSLLDALASRIGLTSDELKAALQDGQPLETLAAQYGVDLTELSKDLDTTTGLLIDVKA